MILKLPFRLMGMKVLAVGRILLWLLLLMISSVCVLVHSFIHSFIHSWQFVERTMSRMSNHMSRMSNQRKPSTTCDFIQITSFFSAAIFCWPISIDNNWRCFSKQETASEWYASVTGTGKAASLRTSLSTCQSIMWLTASSPASYRQFCKNWWRTTTASK